jgi:pimeloyl-ACP methyl ester carboxylesterase
MTATASSSRCATCAPIRKKFRSSLLPNIETAVEIIGGLWDWAVPPSNHRFLHGRIPNSKLDLIDAGHFTWEDAPEEYSEIVTRWWDGGYAALDHGSEIVTR